MKLLVYKGRYSGKRYTKIIQFWESIPYYNNLILDEIHIFEY